MKASLNINCLLSKMSASNVVVTAVIITVSKNDKFGLYCTGEIWAVV